MRLFTAICLDDEAKNALFLAEKAVENFSGGKFTLLENLHLTLVFIGETEREDEIKTALSEIEFPAFDFEISGTGTFEKGIFWAGISENENLRNLQKTVFEKLRETGFEPEEREFVPHITLARKFRPAEDFPFGEIEKLLPENRLSAKRISLMKSENENGVLRYTEIYSVNLS
ncbi:MAG: RNA 2',3'-cyclic phosphodiesterase [Oscillospiraceae bacterium]|nr:RNA 2',3'-cyclic phosphodiesterase [Oscillospiraceae bacterium]